MTTRERRLARAARREEWAAGRAAKAEAAAADVERRSSGIPLGQPILMGHHSQARAQSDHARIARGMDRTVEHARMADHHTQKARGIRAQVDAAIYDDDPDAIERLTAKLAGLEAERDRCKAENAEFRKAHRAELSAMTPYERRLAMPHGSFTNLSATINRTRKRLEHLRRLAGGEQ